MSLNKSLVNFRHTLLSVIIGASFALPAMTAVVPEGTSLAKKQHLVYNNSSNPATLDPQKMEGEPEGMIARQLFEGLVTSDESGKILPGVATHWEHSADFKTWTFHLRNNAKWSNGDKVTAHDFVYAWQRLIDPKTAAPYSTYLKYLTLENAAEIVAGEKTPDTLGVKAVDDYTLELKLTAPMGYVDKIVEHYVLFPVNKAVVEKFGDDWTKIENLVGNGAFKIDSQVVNEKIELSRNPLYWDNENTVLDSITLLPIESANSDINRYRAGEIDISGKEIPPEIFPRLQKELPNELFVTPILCTYNFEINTKKAPFDDVRVRKALALALDRNIITDKVLAQGQVPAYNFTPPYINGAEAIKKAEWSEWSQEKRNEEAKKLLAEAGYTKAHPLNVNFLYNTSENHRKVAIAASSIWRTNLDGAVNVKMENQEWKTYLDTRHNGNYDIARAGWCADYNEATTFLNYFLSTSANNTAFYKSDAYDKAVFSAQVAESDEARAKLYGEAEAIYNNDVPSISVYHYVQPRLVKEYVKGFAVNHPATNYYLKDVYLIRK